MLGEHEETQPAIGSDQPAHLTGELEPGAHVGHPRGRAGEALGDKQLPVAGSGKCVDRVRVGVMDVHGGDERVEERLDRRARRARV